MGRNSMITGSYCNLPSGARGVRCVEGVLPGETVTVRDQSGKTVKHKIMKVLTVHDSIAICAILDDNLPVSVPHRGRVQCVSCNAWYYAHEVCSHCGD